MGRWSDSLPEVESTEGMCDRARQKKVSPSSAVPFTC